MKSLTVERTKAGSGKQKFVPIVGCVAADTWIMTTGCPKPIQYIAEGERIVCYDLRQNCLAEATVDHVDIYRGEFELVEVQLSRGGTPFYVTSNQTFHDGLNWIPCTELRAAITATGDLHPAFAYPCGRIAHTVYNLRVCFGNYLIGDEAVVARASSLRRSVAFQNAYADNLAHAG